MTEYYSIPEVAKKIGIADYRIRHAIKRGILATPPKVCGRRVLDATAVEQAAVYFASEAIKSKRETEKQLDCCRAYFTNSQG